MKRIVAAVALAVTQMMSAQESAVIDVQVTNLDVVVTDKQGKRVTGLTKDDFEVLLDGKRQEISNLSEMSRAANTVTETTQPAPRRILLIVDNASIELAARRKIFDATRTALDKLLLNASDRIAIVTISRSGKQRLDWTSDRAAVMKTLAEIEKDTVLPNADLMAFERSLDQARDRADSEAAPNSQSSSFADGSAPPPVPGQPATGGGGRAMTQDRSVDFQQLITQARAYATSATNDSKQTLSALNGAFNAFNEVSGGRKIAIIAGGGLPLNAAEGPFQQIETLRERIETTVHPGYRNTRTGSTLSQVPAFDIGPRVEAAAIAARLKGVAIYAVNPQFGDRIYGSARSISAGDAVSEFNAQRGMLDGYQRLATLTGGAAMIGRPAEQAVNEIISDLDSYYSLGYRSSGPLTPKSQIVVKVRKGLTARTAIASGAVSRDWEVTDQVLANLVAEPANPLGISVVVDPAVVNGDKKTIPMKVMIPVDSLKLLEDNGEYAAAFAVFISLGDTGGNGSDPTPQEQTFRWPQSAIAQVKGKTIGFAVNLEVAGDRDRVSVGVLDRHSGSAGYARAMLN